MDRINIILNHLDVSSSIKSSNASGESKDSTMNYKFEDLSSTYKYVIVEKLGRVGVIRLNRPKALNALSIDLVAEIKKAINFFENETNNSFGCIIITGNGRAFAAGADIKEMSSLTYPSMLVKDYISPWDSIAACKLPLIAAVNGFAFGGGCELAMMCDIIIADESAKFGQPEILLGTIAGAGGSQRLTRLVGKSKAMEMLLTGIPIGALEAERYGMVSKVVKKDELMPEAIKMAVRISEMSRPVAIIAKQCANMAFETSLQTGLTFERRVFHSTFAFDDRKEGMDAFVNKRKPNFRHQ